MKTYVLTVSRNFPKTHKRAGEKTNFIFKIQLGLGCPDCRITDCDLCYRLKFNNEPKIHTIRSNYELWSKRISEIQKGDAVLSIRYWSDKPYNSKQVEICKLDKDSGIGLQKVELNFKSLVSKVDGNAFNQNIDEIGRNDGLSFDDFKEWFKKYDLSQTMAIIHFTSFRY